MKKVFLPVFLGLFAISSAAAESMTHASRVAETVSKSVAAQDTLKGWRFAGSAAANFSQVSLTNWTAGGENSVAGNFGLKAALAYHKNAWRWNNDLALEFGMTYTQETDWRKNLDRILFASQLSREINSHLFYAALVDFQTQFAKGYDYGTDPDHHISNFMAPAYSNIALGISYKPNANYSVFFSPITLRTTIVLDDVLANAGAYGMKNGNNFLFEPGAYLVARGQQKVMENVVLASRLDLFTPYNKGFGKIDVNWDFSANCKINRFLTASLSTTLRYFERESVKVQFRQMFGLGLTYNF